MANWVAATPIATPVEARTAKTPPMSVAHRPAAVREAQAADVAAVTSFSSFTAPTIGNGVTSRGPGKAPQTSDAFRKFEAFVLQSFIETMLPGGAETVFGKGIAGETWRTMLAEKLASEVAKSGQVGIAERIAASVDRPTDSPTPLGR